MKLLLITGSLLAYLFSFSQTNFDKEAIEPIGDSRFTIGSKGAYGHTFLFPYNNCVYQSSWNVGLSMVYSFTEHFGIGLDGVFSSEGARFRTGDFESRLKLEYIRIPLKAIVFLRKYENDFRPKFSLGPSLGLLQNMSDHPEINKTDWGMNATAGFHYRLLRGFWLSTELDYYHGFSDVIRDNGEKDRNGNLRLNIGLMVGF